VPKSRTTWPRKCVCPPLKSIPDAQCFFFFLVPQGFIPRELVANEVQWFYAHLGIDDTYFRNESVEVISDHIIALFGAKVLAYTKHDPSKLVIDLEKIDSGGNGATFIHTSPPGRTSTEGPGSHVEPRCVVTCLFAIV
jgi:glutamate dehydrogenase